MNMHRRTKVRFLFILPAVFWVLIFTLFPLCYSLYISFHKVENKLSVTREKVPVLDQEGNPVLSKAGKPRTRTNVIREKISSGPMSVLPITNVCGAIRKWLRQ